MMAQMASSAVAGNARGDLGRDRLVGVVGRARGRLGAAPTMKLTYCSQMGWSSPLSARHAAMAWGVACSPRTTGAGSGANHV